MTRLFACLAALAGVQYPVASIAQTASQIGSPPSSALKQGAKLQTSDGKRLGRIDTVRSGKDGSPISVTIILNAQVIHIPTSTITSSADGLVTSMTYREVEHL